MVQPDMKKLVAYSSVSHLGFVVLGIAAMNIQGVQGAVYQMLNHGVSTGGLFLIVGMLSDRRHTRLIAEFGGLKKVDAAPGRRVSDRHAVVDRPARTERIRRRVPDSARRVPLEPAPGGVRRDRRHPVGHLHALDVPARQLRTRDQREECGDEGSHAARVGRARADRRDDGPDGRAAEPVSSPDRAIGRAHDQPGACAGAGAHPGARGPAPSHGRPVASGQRPTTDDRRPTTTTSDHPRCPP